MENTRRKIAFLYYHQYPIFWKDGLKAALNVLKSDYDIHFVNLFERKYVPDDCDFYLGWGAFNSPVDNFMSSIKGKKGLCIAGNTFPPHEGYDMLFHETMWYEPQIKDYPHIHAFGVDTDIYYPETRQKVWDYISVGAFAYWKRQNLILKKYGTKIVVGEVQRDNLRESMDIITQLLDGHVMVSNMIQPEALSVLYNLSHVCYIPSEVIGGGERAVLEARACGIEVEVENDNPKLKELCYCPIYDHKYYAKQLKQGIESCL